MNNPEISREDLQMLNKSMKDPKFHDILGEYMLEVSDPNNRAEHDQYLRQLQNDGELPKGMTLIEPKAFFCLQSRLASETDQKFTQKIYINICTHEEVDISGPSSHEKGGQNWRVPYLVGKNRYDQDVKIGEQPEIVSVVDVVFNHNVRDFCRISSDFKKMVCDIAIDAVNKASAAKKERIDMDYRVVNEFECKGEKPAILPVRAKNAIDGGNLADRNEKPKLYHEIMGIKEQEQQKNANNTQVTNEIEPEPIEAIENGTTPKYKLFYSYETDSSDFIETKSKESKRPSSIKITIELPKVEKLSSLRCDISHQDLVLEYPDVYYLLLKIPVAVDEENYKAKFDRAKKTLNLEFIPLKQMCKTDKHSDLSGKLLSENNVDVSNLNEKEAVSQAKNQDEQSGTLRPQPLINDQKSPKQSLDLISCESSYVFARKGELEHSKVLDPSTQPVAFSIKAMFSQQPDLNVTSITIQRSIFDLRVNNRSLLSLPLISDFVPKSLFILLNKGHDYSIHIYLSFLHSDRHQIDSKNNGQITLGDYQASPEELINHLLLSRCEDDASGKLKTEIVENKEDVVYIEPSQSEISTQKNPKSMVVFNAQQVGNKTIIQLRSDYNSAEDFQVCFDDKTYLLFDQKSNEYFSLRVSKDTDDPSKIKFETNFYGGFVVIAFSNSAKELAYQIIEYAAWSKIFEACKLLQPLKAEVSQEPMISSDLPSTHQEIQSQEPSTVKHIDLETSPPESKQQTLNQEEEPELNRKAQPTVQEDKRPGFGFLNLEIMQEVFELV